MAKLKRQLINDFGTAHMIARAYRAEMIRHLEEVHKPLEDSNRPDIGRIAFVAANLFYTTELYLKTMLIMEMSPVPVTHDLSKIFSCISKVNQEVIEEMFAVEVAKYEESKRPGPGRLVGFAGGSSTVADEAPAAKVSLRDVLASAGSDYTTWRYLYSRQRDKHRIDVTFYYFELICLCNSIEYSITETLRHGPDGQVGARKHRKLPPDYRM